MKTAIDRMEKENVTICEYCGKEKEGLSFVIGASNEPDWVMNEGTGRISCPDCYHKARMHSEYVINRLIKEV